MTEIPGISPELPLLSRETVSKLRADIGLAEQTVNTDSSPFLAVRNLTRSVFLEVADENRPLVEVVYADLADKFDDNVPAIDAFTAGMAVTLQAFELEDQGLFTRMGKLTEEDLKIVQAEMARGLEAGAATNILRNVLQAPRIPDTHLQLQDCARNAGITYGTNQFHTEMGAASMFRALEKVWSKVGPLSSSAPLNSATSQA